MMMMTIMMMMMMMMIPVAHDRISHWRIQRSITASACALSMASA